MNNELKMKMREYLLEFYNIDIEQTKCFFSTQNYAFIPHGQSTFMIRVSATPKKTRSEIMSELLWVDDLKIFKQTICEPNVSLRGNLLEEFEIDGKTYRASMFRTARGSIKRTGEMTPMYFICVGELLGTIHFVSEEEAKDGFKFLRKSKAEDFTAIKERTFPKIPEEIQQRILKIEEQVNRLPQEIGLYGLCHGDFHMNNFFVEDNNIWVFDFDGCAYANYMYDIASFIQACFLGGYGAGKNLRQMMNDELLHYFKIGYELKKKSNEEFWDSLDLFLAYRTAYTYMSLSEIDDIGVVSDVHKVKQLFSFLITQDDILEGMTKAMGQSGAVI